MNFHTTDKTFVTRLIPFLLLSCCLANHLNAQSLVKISGDGQMQLAPSFLTVEPLVVQANDANGNPLPGVAITWAVTAGSGTLPDASHVTDATGQSSTHFTTTQLQPEASFLESTVTATSKYGSISFYVIAVPFVNENQSQATPPTIKFDKPGAGATISALPGSTLPGAVVVEVLAGGGAQTNAPIPHVSLHIVNALDPTKPATAQCNGTGGYVYTDVNGVAKCDLVITGAPGESSLGANAGMFSRTASFLLNITPGPVCTYSIAPTVQPISSKGGPGNVTVTTAASCGWAASSNVDWIAITSGASGTGDGTVSYSVGADADAPRSGTLTIAGQTLTVNEGSGGGSLTITTPANLPGGTINQSYSTTLAASGGIAPYTWSITAGALPSGLTINKSTGLISGAVTASGEFIFTASVQDDAGTTASTVFSLTIGASSSSFTITNTSFPNGIVNQSYKQSLTSSGGAVTPFFPNPAFTISGGALPPGLTIVRNPDGSSSLTGTPTTAGQFDFTITATDAAQNSTAGNFSIAITGTPTSELMTVSPSTLSFTVQLGSTDVPAVQPLSITGNTGLLAYTSVLTTTGGGSWLVAQNSTSGNTPGALNISVANYSNLAPGPYTGAVTVSSAASNSPVIVMVTLTVLAAPSLVVDLPQITVTQGMSSASNVTQQSIQVTAGLASSDISHIHGSDATSIAFSVTATTNKGGNWLTVSPTVGTTPATLTVTIDSGGLSIGHYSGTIMVTPTFGAPQTVTVTLNVINPQVLSAAPAPLAFNFTVGAQLPEAQSVTVSSNTGPPLSLTAAATTDKGNWLIVAPSSGGTPLALFVSVNPSGLAPNTYQGTITVTASDDSVTPLPIPVTLTVLPAGPNIASVTNAASFVTGPVAPGEIVTIFGSELGPATLTVADTSSGKIGRELAGTQVFFDSLTAPILYTSAGQVAAIVPYGLSTASATKLSVWYQGVASAADNLRVVDSAPGIFVVNATSGQGAILNQDGTLNSSSNGATVGSEVSLFATGEGQTNPPGVTGSINGTTLPLPAPQLTVTAQIGGLPATVKYAGAAPGELAGLLQVNLIVPTGVPAGSSVPIVITVGTASSQTGVNIAIK